MRKSYFLFSAAIKLLAAAAFFYGTIKTFEGIITFTKFTYLSGAFSSFALLISFVRDVLILFGRREGKPAFVYTLKFSAALSSALTFFVYLLFLAPSNGRGFIGAYLFGDCGSLCLHAVNPVFASLDFFLFDYRYSPKARHLIGACLFPAAYVVFVFALKHMGVTWNGLSVPYSFLDTSSLAGWFGVDSSGGSLKIGVAYCLFAMLLGYLAVGAVFMALIRLRAKIKRPKIKITVRFGGEFAG